MAAMPQTSPISRALWVGAVAGAVVGVGDVVATAGRLSQFLDGAAAKVDCALHTVGLYGLFGGLTAAALSTVAYAWLRLARLGSPQRSWLSFAIAFVPTLAAMLILAHAIALQTLAARHHHGLIAAVVIAVTVAATVLAIIVALPLRRLVAPLLGRGSAVAVIALLLLGVAMSAFVARHTLEQLPLRPWLASAAWLVAFPPLWLTLRLSGGSRRLRVGMHAALVALLVALALAGGRHAQVRKAAAAHTGLGGQLAEVLRKTFDFDRDGYSAILGGGDCNDFDRAIHPGAVDVPDDGIDQNCLGGDLQLVSTAHDAHFVDLPATVPRGQNILFITIDTLRADHVGAYGYARATTPTLDALAADGALFENAWAHAP